MNYLTNPVQLLADVTAKANYDKVFPPIEYWSRNFEASKNLSVSEMKELGNHTPETHPHLWIKKERNPTPYDYEIVGFFPQTWGSTALGFGGIGGAAVTTAYTVVIKMGKYFAVFFSNNLAYTIEDPNQQFFEDLASRNMQSVANVKNYT